MILVIGFIVLSILGVILLLRTLIQIIRIIIYRLRKNDGFKLMIIRLKKILTAFAIKAALNISVIAFSQLTASTRYCCSLRAAPEEHRWRRSVNWDQPGSGKSYYAERIKNITVDTYIQDGYALTQYLK